MKLTIEVTPPVQQMLTQLVQSGFYGHNESEAAERLICQTLDDRRRNSISVHESGAPCPDSPDGQHFPGCGCD